MNLSKMKERQEVYYDQIDSWNENFNECLENDDTDGMKFALEMMQKYDKMADAIDEKINNYELAEAKAKAEAKSSRNDIISKVAISAVPVVAYGVLSAIIVKRDDEEPIVGKAKWTLFNGMNNKMNK